MSYYFFTPVYCDAYFLPANFSCLCSQISFPNFPSFQKFFLPSRQSNRIRSSFPQDFLFRFHLFLFPNFPLLIFVIVDDDSCHSLLFVAIDSRHLCCSSPLILAISVVRHHLSFPLSFGFNRVRSRSSCDFVCSRSPFCPNFSSLNFNCVRFLICSFSIWSPFSLNFIRLHSNRQGRLLFFHRVSVEHKGEFWRWLAV